MNETPSEPFVEHLPAGHAGPAWLTVPVAILVAGTMVAASIVFVGAGGNLSFLNTTAQIPSGDTGGDEPKKVADPDSLVESDEPSIGDKNAPVTIVEFSDFQCPFCRRFWTDTYAQLRKEYIDTGKVRLVFRDYPLPFHDAAKPSALAANCAHDQGKFWQYHDKIFAEQQKKDPSGTVTYGIPELKSWAQQLGLDMGKFNQCLDGAKYSGEVENDIAAGAANGVSGTPSFFINGTLLVGAQPFSTFKPLIDAALE